jgi:CRISPR/Cas system type I-B associated protein Csh2 (Cas7 group RAMP superfamily)
MKHILNNLSNEEKNSIREQHTGGMNVITENFSKLINSKLGNSKPLVAEQSEMGEDFDMKKNSGEMYQIEKNKLERGLYEIEEFIKKGDTETALHILMVLRFTLKKIDSFVEDLTK